LACKFEPSELFELLELLEPSELFELLELLEPSELFELLELLEPSELSELFTIHAHVLLVLLVSLHKAIGGVGEWNYNICFYKIRNCLSHQIGVIKKNS